MLVLKPVFKNLSHPNHIFRLFVNQKHSLHFLSATNRPFLNERVKFNLDNHGGCHFNRLQSTYFLYLHINLQRNDLPHSVRRISATTHNPSRSGRI